MIQMLFGTWRRRIVTVLACVLAFFVSLTSRADGGGHSLSGRRAGGRAGAGHRANGRVHRHLAPRRIS